MKFRFAASAVAVLAASALVLTGCASGSSSSPQGSSTSGSLDTNNPFDIVWAVGVTGATASLTAAQKIALDAAISDVNAQGGILGREVTLETVDTKSDPTQAVTALQARLSSGKAPDLVGMFTSGEALAMLPITSRAGIPSWTLGSNTLQDSPDYPLNITTTSTGTAFAKLIRTFTDAKKYTSVGILAAQNGTGDAYVAGFNAAYQGSSTKTSETRFDPTALDQTAVYQQAIASNPDVIVIDCVGAQCGPILAARAAVPGALNIPVIATPSLTGTPGGAAALAPSAESIQNVSGEMFYSQVQKTDAQTTDEFKAFYSAYTAGGGNAGVATPALVWDAVHVWAAAFNKAGTDDAAQARKAVASLDLSGKLATYGQATVSYSEDHPFPAVDDPGYLFAEAGPEVKGLAPATDVFAPWNPAFAQ